MYNINSLKAEEFISHEEIEATLAYADANMDNLALIDEILAKARLGKGLNHREASVLLACEQENITQQIYELAEQIKKDYYGNRIVLFAPLYLSNYCVNGCVYCPYHLKNKHIARKKLTQEEIQREVTALQDMGHKRLAIEAGEDPVNNPIEYILECIDTIYSIKQALAVSSNIALAQIVTESYNGSAKKFVKKLNNMGLTDSVDYIIPGAQQALIAIPNDTVTISKMAYGYSVELSPLQMLMFYNGIANNGKMITPVLVKKICQGDKIVESFETEVINNHLCNSATLRDIKECLHAVVWDNDLGTASVNPWGMRKAQSKLVSIAGKTGTAQIKGSNGYSSSRHRMSFVGYFPEENPQYSCICVIHGPRNNGYYDAGMDCGSVVRNIAEKTMAYTNEYIIKDGKLIFAQK